MRIKIVFDNQEYIHMLANAVIFLARQADRVMLCFSEDKLVLQIQKPFCFIELMIKKLAASYVFKGSEPIINEDIPYVYVECMSRTMISVFDTYHRKATQRLEMKMTQEGKLPLLDFRGTIKTEKSTSYVEFQLPVVYVSHVEMSITNLMDKLHFDFELKLPKFKKFRKYVDMFRDFKIIRIAANEGELVVYSEVEETKIMACFRKSKLNKDMQSVNFYEDFFKKNRYEVQVDWKLLNHFLHSINAMSYRNIELTCSIHHKRVLKLSFTVPIKEISFHFFLEHIENDNDDLSDSN
ncbi:hypothetical protein PVAND_010730 [Polypedilum vanderplanki]|uniref:Checkpoint protein n=1 Tax=Polypedilum vanderplanki TaxID=319348 RepID=A0A9J6CHD3_POLVA|nr:hypothetical protein PVAND_010730 [Polypedilum vanderplanki]